MIRNPACGTPPFLWINNFMKHETMLMKTCVLHSHIIMCTFFLALMSTEAGGDTAEINIPFNVCLSKSWKKMRVLRARQPAQLRIQDLTYFHPILTSGFRQHVCTCVNNAEKAMKTRFLRSQISQITTFSDLKKRKKKTNNFISRSARKE